MPVPQSSATVREIWLRAISHSGHSVQHESRGSASRSAFMKWWAWAHYELVYSVRRAGGFQNLLVVPRKGRRSFFRPQVVLFRLRIWGSEIGESGSFRARL